MGLIHPCLLSDLRQDLVESMRLETAKVKGSPWTRREIKPLEKFLGHSLQLEHLAHDQAKVFEGLADSVLTIEVSDQLAPSLLGPAKSAFKLSYV